MVHHLETFSSHPLVPNQGKYDPLGHIFSLYFVLAVGYILTNIYIYYLFTLQWIVSGEIGWHMDLKVKDSRCSEMHWENPSQ